MTRSVLFLISTAALAVILVACGGSSPAESLDKQLESLRKQRSELDERIAKIESKLREKDPIIAVQPVSVATTTLADFEHIIDVRGTVDSRTSVQVTPKTAGQIIKLNIVNGQSVTKGQVIAELDADILRRGIDELQTQLDFSKTLFEKQKRIYEAKAGSEIQYLQAKNTFESLQKRMDQLEEQLAMSRIVAPVSGYVDNVIPKLGENVAPGMPICTIINTSDMRVAVDLSETYVSTVTPGDPVTIIFTETGDTIRTTTSVVSKNISPLNRTFRVEVPLRSLPSSIRPNMTCNVLLNDQTVRKTISLPIAAVQRNGETSFVYTVDDKSMVRRRDVQTGLTSNGSIQIVSGLSAGERVVVRGVLDVAEGQRVSVVQ
ncbi:MAG TPA: efflux RND transporter periplasmic adaptor subunit [Chlorobiota bacterium]|nr:efflux RND transporter periplasmic adaptor subunit [Chlorobiota bacterium]